MAKLHFHAITEEPLMQEVVDAINRLLFDAQERGLSLSGGLNCLAHAMTLVLVSAYSDNPTRLRVAADIPDVIRAYIPQWERLIAAWKASPPSSKGGTSAPAGRKALEGE